MKRYIHKKHSIYMQMMLLLVTGAVIAGLLFLVMDSMTERLVDRYMEKGNYREKRNQELIEDLQDYISSGQVHSREAGKLSNWVKKQKLVSVSIYKDGIQVFDSDYPDKEIWDEEIHLPEYDWMSYSKIEFSDGEAEVVLNGAYQYQISSNIWIIEIIISFSAFLIIVLLGLRKKMAYIRLLSAQVEVLEGGSLEFPVTIKGKDEIAVLAEGLDSMRKSFLESRSKEERIVQENQRVITEMSHDLRTPITSIMLYTEILKSEKYQSKEQEKAYINKIDQKAHLIKNRTDRLLEYSLKSEDRGKPETEQRAFSDAFYDRLSETCGYLEQKGFQIETDVQWTNQLICYYEDSVVRIMDNIMSNIEKYADPHYPIRIISLHEDRIIGLRFENRIDPSDVEKESAGIGIQSIGRLMKELDGECRSDCEEECFWVEIRFWIQGKKSE